MTKLCATFFRYDLREAQKIAQESESKTIRLESLEIKDEDEENKKNKKDIEGKKEDGDINGEAGLLALPMPRLLSSKYIYIDGPENIKHSYVIFW